MSVAKICEIGKIGKLLYVENFNTCQDPLDKLA
jgi:hypothetical protein